MDNLDGQIKIDDLSEMKAAFEEARKTAIDSLKSDLNTATVESKPVVEMDRNVNVERASNSNIIQSANNQVLLEVLSPQVIENEKRKRTHKGVLLGIVAVFIIIQFLITFYLISKTYNFIFDTYKIKGAIDTHLINMLFAFLTGYITSVVVELIYMLKFMVQNVFDTSIADLVKLFKEDKKK